MITDKLTRAAAFMEFDAAAAAFATAKTQSKEHCDRAVSLEAEARELRERASTELDRALLAYSLAHTKLRAVIDLDRWDAERADRLVKSAADMAKLTSGEGK